MKNTSYTYESKTMKKKEQKAARTESRLDRLMNSSAKYMSNFAVVRGNLPSFNNNFFQV